MEINKIEILKEEVSNNDSKTYGRELNEYLLELFEAIISVNRGR